MGRNIVVTGLMRDIMNESRIGGVNGGAGGSGAREGGRRSLHIPQ